MSRGGKTIKNFAGFLLFWVIGVLAAMIILSLTRNEAVDWMMFLVLSASGIIGALIFYIFKRNKKSSI
ncbi:hypothetical protein D3H55_16635 [Bacillus salacetis]|uniref:Uncharacterized protein n=1 Tax=Bacillus salacetis TaxID=2315464 RepID=A0A3A1QU12_9BACI|nr:hypothetical protein [Bacillus salacetis]RIW30365.1 hypothetical protein D3H55_16635 [Bacillus salacetis]